MKTIIEMVREANEYADTNWALWPTGNRWKEIRDERFAELVRAEAQAEEREACAKVCEEQEYHYWRATEDQDFTPQDCANAIRARGNT